MYEVALLVLKTFNEHHFKAYIVGGYPRDYYLNRESFDVDICTNATPKQIKEMFEDSILSKEQYGSVTVIIKNIRFEITTFRKEMKYENNRFPVKIKYIDNLLDDLKRRDFTINTLCIDYQGEMIDLLNAKEDIDNKVIRVVGIVDKKIKDDILRSLRAIRFATILDFTLDDKLKKTIIKYRKLLLNLSYFRKKDELEKIFSSTNANYGISLLEELGLFKYLSLNKQKDIIVTTCSLGIWAQFDDISNYPFSSHEKEIIKNVKKVLKEDILNNDILYHYGLFVCTLAGEIKKIDRNIIVSQYNALPIFNSKDIAITVKEMCTILKRKPGSFVKDIIKDIEKAILSGKIENKKEDLISFIKKYEM